jgi:hypothetical protein
LIPRQFKYDETGEIIWAHRASQLSPELHQFLHQLVRCDSQARFGSAQAALEMLAQVPEFLAFQRGETDLAPIDGPLCDPGDDDFEMDSGEAIADTKVWHPGD